MRKFLIALALLLGIIFLLTRTADLHDVLAVLQRGNIVFIGLACLVQLYWIYNLGAYYRSIYHLFGIEQKRLHMLKLSTAAYFVSVIAPSAGLTAFAVYLSDAKRQGFSIPRVTVICVLYIWFEYIGTLALLVLGLGELAHRNNLHWSEITASLILLAGALGMGLLLYLGMRSSAALGTALAWMAGSVNLVVRPFLHREYLSIERAHWFSKEVAEGISAMREHPRWVIRPLGLSLLSKALLFLVLYLCFLAFEVPADAGLLVAGLSLSQLFLIVSPTPAGIGVVEGILAVGLRTLGVELGDATVITLAYRGFSFWLPLFVGMFTVRTLSLSGPTSADQVIPGDPVPPGVQEKLKIT